MTEKEQNLVDLIQGKKEIILLHEPSKNVILKGKNETLEEFSSHLKKLSELYSLCDSDPGKLLESIILDDMLPRLRDDIREVYFSKTNFSLLSSGVTEKGVPYYLCMAGEDWELPVRFFIYPDAEHSGDPRCYIPRTGNLFRADIKCAFGSEEDLCSKYTDEDLRLLDTLIYIIKQSGLSSEFTNKEIENVARSLDFDETCMKLRSNENLMLNEFNEKLWQE